MTVGGALVTSCLQLLWPARCAACDVVLPDDDAIFCGPCAQSLCPIAFACPGCALPLPRPTWSFPPARCPGCTRREFAFSRAFAGFEYGEALAAAIIRMKHGDRPDLARRLGRVFEDTVARALHARCNGSVDAVLPVPLSRRRLRGRGFNQALALARIVLGRIRSASLSSAGFPSLERQLLVRVRDTPKLGHSGPRARRLDVKGAFAVTSLPRVVGRRFLVIDDVMTTGATLNECAETLVRAGAKEVWVAALARAVV
jgi:ComF family protein